MRVLGKGSGGESASRERPVVVLDAAGFACVIGDRGVGNKYLTFAATDSSQQSMLAPSIRTPGIAFSEDFFLHG